MKMVIGGSYQGKKEFAIEKFGLDPEKMADGETCTLEDILRAESVYNFHLFIAGLIKADQDPAAVTEEIIQRRPDLLVISNEVGYGLVPVDPFERRWREAVGRCSTEIAAASTQVWRVICGTGLCIKGGKGE